MLSIMLLRAALRRPGLTLRIPRAQRRLQSNGVKPEETIPVPGTVAPLPIWQRLGPLTAGARTYARWQGKRPLATQFWTAVFIYACADLSAQNVGDDEYDVTRTGRSILIGGVAALPTYKW